MELDNLKTIWREQDPQPDLQLDLQALLQKRSQGPIARMRRNLHIEGLLMVVTYIPTIIAYLDLFEGRLRSISVIMALIFVFYWVYYYRKNQLLKKMQCVTCEVRSNLARQIGTLQKYLKFYLWSGTILTLTAIFISMQIMRYARHSPAELSPHWWFEPVLLLGVLIPFGILSFFANRWYVNKLYGRHTEKLRKLLREMDEV